MISSHLNGFLRFLKEKFQGILRNYVRFPKISRDFIGTLGNINEIIINF